jgi:hypothetical protein
VNATTDGVVRLPSALAMTTGCPASMTATQEFVVPKSMPTTFAIVKFLHYTCPKTVYGTINEA